MAGSATIISNKKDGLWRKIVWKLTSDSSGAVSGVGELTIPTGSINSFWSVPTSGVSDQFDLTLTGKFILDNGTVLQITDLLHGTGANLSNSTNGEVKNVDVVLPVGHTIISPVVANMGNAQSIYLILFIWEE